MKLGIAMALLGALGIGSFQFTQSPSAAAAPASCNAMVSCTPDGHCRIECERPDGSPCWVELACDGGSCEVVNSNCDGPCAQDCPERCDMPCDRPCDMPCDMPCGAK